MKNLEIRQSILPYKKTIEIPSSKSISNRLLIMRFLSNSDWEIENLSTADDTVLLDEILQEIQTGEIKEFNVKNAGTAMRFLTAALAVTSGRYTLNCDERMKLRPIATLVDSLRNLGADIIYLEKDGFPPLRISGKKMKSNPIKINTGISSQFVSALLMIAPLLDEGLELELIGDLVSQPYISMTISLMQLFGIEVEQNQNSIFVHKGLYKSFPIRVEADWSSAAFFYEVVALSPLLSELFISGVNQNSLQGDAIVANLFASLGVETTFLEDGIRIQKVEESQKNIRMDFSNHPDLALPIIAACAGLEVIGTFTGLENLIYKESNRVEALSKELAKLGYDFRETGFGEWVLINSCSVNHDERAFPENIEIETYNDHRVAMAFAPFVLLTKSLSIKNPQVVVKSFSGFWEEFDKITASIL